MKEKLHIRGKEIFRYFYPIILGNYIMLFFRWKWFWEVCGKIVQVSFEESIIEWGNTLLRLTIMIFLAIHLKWDIRREVFYDKGKIALKRKILWVTFSIFLQDVCSEMIWKLHGYGDGIKGVYENSYWILDSISEVNVLLLMNILAAALTEEVFFRYIICNCLRKLHMNCGVIIILQAVIFAVVHGYGFIDFLNVFVGGIIYGIVLYLTRTPFCSWVMHSAYNLKVICDGPMENLFFWIEVIVCVIYVIVSELLYKNKMKKKKKRRTGMQKTELASRKDRV